MRRKEKVEEEGGRPKENGKSGRGRGWRWRRRGGGKRRAGGEVKNKPNFPRHPYPAHIPPKHTHISLIGM